MRRAGVAVVAVGVSGYAALQVAGRRAGSTAAERAAPLPGDEIVSAAQIVTDHAVTVDAPASQVWPWLTQMGWHRGGYYTPDWVDLVLFPANWPSATRLDPALLRALRPGDTIPDGPPDTAWYVVAEVAMPHVLVLHSTTHVPPGWGERFGASIDWTWCFSLTDVGRQTRLHLRVRGRMAPWWLLAGYHALIVPADFVMARGMLRGIKQRVEGTAEPVHSGSGTVGPRP